LLDLFADFFCALRCIASPQAKNGLPPQHAKTARGWGAPACWEQLRASLRRKELFWWQPYGIPIRTFAEVFNLSELDAKKLLQSLPVIEEGYDYIVRLQDAKTAEAVANQFRGWFTEYPGFYKPIESFILQE